MEISARRATSEDVPILGVFYRLLEKEQAALRPLWPLADGLDEPIAEAIGAAIGDATTLVVVGMLDGVPLGFALATTDELLAQAAGERVGTVRLIYSLDEARGVGVGAAMIDLILTEFRSRGLVLFDARVSPGHRNAKNFFEAHGFSARLIVMHHADQEADDG